MGTNDEDRPNAKQDKAARLAARLRENLKKRKDLARTRKSSGGQDDAANNG